MEKNVNKFIFDWFAGEYGEEFAQNEVGKSGVVKIGYHEPMGDGDRHYCDVAYEDGTIIRKFNLNSIEFAVTAND